MDSLYNMSIQPLILLPDVERMYYGIQSWIFYKITSYQISQGTQEICCHGDKTTSLSNVEWFKAKLNKFWDSWDPPLEKLMVARGPAS